MSKINLLLLAIALTIFGISVTFGHPAWGTITGLAMLILAAGIAVGAMPLRLESEDYIVDRSVAGQKISNNLVALSSAAILAVYAAGYHRTGSAADRFAAQTALPKAAAPIPPGDLTPIAPLSGVGATPAARPSLAPPVRAAHPSAASAAVPNAAPATEPTRDSQATPSAPVAPITSSAATTHDPGAEPAAPVEAISQVHYKDGTYLGWGYCNHGDLQVSVVVQGGQITSAVIAQCLTRYPCSRIAPTLPIQVLTRQSPEAYHFVSGATESSYAFYEAVAKALSNATK